MNIKRIAALLLIAVLAVSMTAGCSGKEEEEYALIIDTSQTYSYAMSRYGGLFLIPIVDDIEYLSFSCNKGSLSLQSGSLAQGENGPETGAKKIELYQDDVSRTVYWMPEPISKDGGLPMTEDVITIHAKLSDASKVYQVVNVVVEDGITFTVADSGKGE